MTGKKNKGKEENVEPLISSGSYIFPNGDQYEGEFTKTDLNIIERNGHGTFTSIDGTTYYGEWANDKMNGTGQLTFSSGAKYQGSFKDNKFDGTGTYTWPNGSSYTGDFSENKLIGKGEFTDTESQQWIGNFHYKAAPGLKFKLCM